MKTLVILLQWHGPTEQAVCSVCEGAGTEYIVWADKSVPCQFCDGTGTREGEMLVVAGQKLRALIEKRYGHSHPYSIRDWWMT